MVEKRKLINQKATSFASRTEEVSLANKQEFEEIVGEVNQVKEGLRRSKVSNHDRIAESIFQMHMYFLDCEN